MNHLLKSKLKLIMVTMLALNPWQTASAAIAGNFESSAC